MSFTMKEDSNMIKLTSCPFWSWYAHIAPIYPTFHNAQQLCRILKHFQRLHLSKEPFPVRH